MSGLPRSLKFGLLLSLWLHLLGLGGLWWGMPDLPKKDPSRPLEARLIAARPTPGDRAPLATVPVPEKKILPQPRPAAQRRAAAAPSAPIPGSGPGELPLAPATPSAVSTVAVADEPPPLTTNPTAASTAPSAAPVDLSERMPTEGRLTYVVLRGEENTEVGKTTYSWKVQDGRYQLEAITETVGFVALFKTVRIVYRSEGQLGAQGFQPQMYSMQRGSEAADRATFDWSAKMVTLQRGNQPQTVVPLPEYTQDFATFPFQMALLSPPAGALDLRITNGRKLYALVLENLGVESVDTELGQLRGLHLRQRQEGGEDYVDIWLAVDYRYMPIKIRNTDRKRVQTEQVIRNVEFPAGPAP